VCRVLEPAQLLYIAAAASRQQAAFRPSTVMRMFLASFINNDYTHRPKLLLLQSGFSSLGTFRTKRSSPYVCAGL
jgi:hypothetical protein